MTHSVHRYLDVTKHKGFMATTKEFFKTPMHTKKPR